MKLCSFFPKEFPVNLGILIIINLIGCSNAHTWLNFPEIRLCWENSLACCLLVKPIVLIRTQSLIVGLWRAVGQDTDLQRALFVSLDVIQEGGMEGSRGLKLMSLWSWSVGPVVPDAPLSHSLSKTPTVNSQNHGADRLTQTCRPLASIIYPPCDWSPGNCRFKKRKTSSGSSKSAFGSDSLFR